MIALKINGEKHEIPAISELTFKQFNDTVVKSKVTKLQEYLSIFTSMSVEELMSSKIKSVSITSLYHHIFNVSVKEEINRKYESFTHNGNTFEMKEMSIDLFGEHYLFSLIFNQYKNKSLNVYELGLYALAISLSNTQEMQEIEEIYMDLQNKNWRDVLPHGFFLLKKLCKKNKGLRRLLIICILELSVIHWRIKYQAKKLKHMEKKLLASY